MFTRTHSLSLEDRHQPIASLVPCASGAWTKPYAGGQEPNRAEVDS